MKVRHSFLVVFVSLVLCSCAAITKEEKNYSKNGLTIAFRSLSFLDDVQNVKFIYPIILSEENIRNHLLSLYHQDILRPRKPTPVFSVAAVKKMAPLFNCRLLVQTWKIQLRRFLLLYLLHRLTV